MRHRFIILMGLVLVAFLPPTALAGDPEIVFLDPDGIKVMDRDGANVQLVYAGGDTYPRPWTWSPDGKSFVLDAFREPRAGSARDVLRIDLDGGALRVIGPANGYLNDTDPPVAYGNLARPTWSPGVRPSGAGEIAATTVVGDLLGNAVNVIVAMSDQGDEGVDLVYTSDRPFPALSTAPTWSPDGSQIATFERTHATPPDPEYELIIIDRASGSKVRAIPFFGWNLMRDPDWSPDGKKIAFTSGPTRQTIQVFVSDLALESITPIVVGLHPSWSPDGSQLVFSSFNDKIKRYTFSTGEVETLIAGESPNWGPGSSCVSNLDCDIDDICCDGWCAGLVCVVDGDCDDGDECTTNICSDGGTCTATCSNTHPACGFSDGCCPPSCTSGDDPDCGACVPTHEKEKGPRCRDGLDNDCDGMIDGEDPDCR